MPSFVIFFWRAAKLSRMLFSSVVRVGSILSDCAVKLLSSAVWVGVILLFLAFSRSLSRVSYSCFVILLDAFFFSKSSF
jgi:energy-converting hydrogenase Eha subunit E